MAVSDADTPPPPQAHLPIAGIGASAGGLEPVEILVRRLTADGMAYIVLQHSSPGHETSLEFED